MATDFFGVSLSGRIREFFTDGSSERKTELWVQSGQVTGLGERLDALAFVSQINVDLKFGDNCSISLVLTPPFEDALVFMQSELVRFGVGRLEVELAYKTGSGSRSYSTMEFSGFLQKPEVSIGSDITITLHALGVGYQMNVIGGTDSMAFPADTTWADAVKSTLVKYVSKDGSGNGLNIDKLYDRVTGNREFFSAPAVRSDGNRQPATDKVVSGIIVKGPRNDWWFVKETLHNFGLELLIEGDDIMVVDHEWLSNNLGQAGSRKKFLLRGELDPSRNMYPILSFQSPTTATWLEPGVGRLRSFDAPMDKGATESESNSSTADTDISRAKHGGSTNPTYYTDMTSIDTTLDGSKLKLSYRNKKTGLASTPASFLTLSNDAKKNIKNAETESVTARIANGIDIAERTHPGNPEHPKTSAQQDSQWRKLNMKGGIQGEFTTIGIPSLVPGELIEVSGFQSMKGNDTEDTALFNGAYGVTGVRHSIGVGGWETSFSALLNFFPEDFRKAVAASKSPPKEKVQQTHEPIPGVNDLLYGGVIAGDHKDFVKVNPDNQDANVLSGLKGIVK